MGRYTARLPRTTRSKPNDPQCLYPTPRPFYEKAVADKVLRKDNIDKRVRACSFAENDALSKCYTWSWQPAGLAKPAPKIPYGKNSEPKLLF
jgi:hypothetical protein